MSEQHKTESLEFEQTCQIIIKLGKAAHAYGSPAGRLEAYLKRLSGAFNIDGEFRSTPGEMTFAFKRKSDNWHKVYVTSVAAGMDLTRLLSLDRLVDQVIAGNVKLPAVECEIEKINTAPPSFGNIANTFAYSAVGAGLAVLFAGSWVDVVVSALLGLIVFGMTALATAKGGWQAEWLPLSTAFITATLAMFCKTVFPGLNHLLVTIAAIAVLLPGFTISVGIAELLNDHVLSGMSNLMNGLVFLLKQFSGAWLGFSLAIFLPIASETLPVTVSPVWLWIYFPLIVAGLLIVYQIPREDFFWAAVITTLAYLGVILGSFVSDANLGNFLGAMFVGITTNFWEKQTGRPGSIVLLPAMTLLVSGSVGFRGLVHAAEGNTSGTDEFVQMFLVALTLTAGLVVANTLVKQRKSL